MATITIRTGDAPDLESFLASAFTSTTRLLPAAITVVFNVKQPMPASP